MLPNVIETTENCRYCLMCRHIAPVGHVTQKEALTPRGVALIVASQKRGMIEWDAESVDVIYSEVDAGNSRAHCVTRQPFEEAIVAAKANIVKAGVAPDIVYELREKLEKYHTPFSEIKSEITDDTGEIAVLFSDEVTYLYPEIEESVLKLLDAVGIKPVIVGRGRSTGYLASSIGYPDLAKKQAELLIKELETTGINQLLVLSAGDYFTVSTLYNERLDVKIPDNIQVLDLSMFLDSKIADNQLQFNSKKDLATYAYVDPTHAVRVPNRHEAPRQLVEAVVNGNRCELFWRKERAHPVGSTALQFTQPKIADMLTHARLHDAITSGVKTIICEDPATLFQLKRFASDYELEVIGLYELLAESLS